MEILRASPSLLVSLQGYRVNITVSAAELLVLGEAANAYLRPVAEAAIKEVGGYDADAPKAVLEGEIFPRILLAEVLLGLGKRLLHLSDEAARAATGALQDVPTLHDVEEAKRANDRADGKGPRGMLPPHLVTPYCITPAK